MQDKSHLSCVISADSFLNASQWQNVALETLKITSEFWEILPLGTLYCRSKLLELLFFILSNCRCDNVVELFERMMLPLAGDFLKIRLSRSEKQETIL